jgi:predicted aspartyl protease
MNTAPQRPRYTLLLLLTLSTLATLAPPIGHATDQKAPSLDDYLKKLRYQPVELRFNDYKLTIQAQLNGKQETFLVDSGASMTLLSPSTAKGVKRLGELGVALDDSILGRLTNASLAIMDKLVLGRAQFFNQPAVVKDLRMEYVHVAFKGVLGDDFFRRNHCLIACAGDRLYFPASAPSAAESEALAESLRRSGFAEVPIHPTPMLTIAATVNDQPTYLLVDTGAAFNNLHEPWAKSLALKPVRHERVATGTFIPEDVSAHTMGFDIGLHKFWVTAIKDLEIGNRKWKDVDFAVTDLHDWKIERFGSPGKPVQGILGLAMLRGHGALIDCSSLKLWFAPEKKSSHQ